MKKILLILTIVTCLTTLTSNAQDNKSDFIPKKNTTYLEIGGSAVWYSINYERNFKLADRHHFLFGAGLSVIPLSIDAYIMILPTIGYLYGNEKALEVSITQNFEIVEGGWIPSVKIGYRRNWNNGFQFRFGIAPIYSTLTGGKGEQVKTLLPWPYLSIGYSF